MRKINQLIQSVNEIKQNFGLPLTGGDVYGKKELITALNNNLSVDGLTSKKRKKNTEYQTYFHMIMISNHYQNLFRLNSQDNNFKLIWSIALQCAWFNGSVGFHYSKDVLGNWIVSPMFLMKPEINNQGEIYKSSGIPAVLTINSNAMFSGAIKDDKKFLKENKNKVIELNQSNCVFMKWNTNMLSAWILWKPFLDEQTYLRNHSKNTYIMGATNAVLKTIDVLSTETSKTITTLLDSEQPIKVLADVGGKNPFPAQIETIDFKSGQSLTMNQLAYLDAYDTFWYERLGYRHNVNDKKERNVSSEIEYSQNEFSTKEHEHLQYIEIAIQQLKDRKIISELIQLEQNEIEKSGTISNNSNDGGDQNADKPISNSK